MPFEVRKWNINSVIKRYYMEYCILDWMNGSRKYFRTEEEAIKEYRKLKVESIDHQIEFDMLCFKLLMEYNNVL